MWNDILKLQFEIFKDVCIVDRRAEYGLTEVHSVKIFEYHYLGFPLFL